VKVVRITLTVLSVILASMWIPFSAHASSMSSSQQTNYNPVTFATAIEMQVQAEINRDAVARWKAVEADNARRAPKPKPARSSRVRSAAVVAPRTSGDIYDALANCETHMTNISSASGRYHSYFQWARYTTVINGKTVHVDTWKSLGGEGLAEDNSYDVQKQMVKDKIPISSWGTQFPGCAKKLGVG
jgi:hypothetical protein